MQGLILNDCKFLLDSRTDISVRWIRRNTTLAAHTLDIESIRHNRLSVWDDISLCLMEFY